MASRREVVEAQAYNRRRLVTAFVSGAPGGREVEPARPLRSLVAGLVVAALLLAGAAVLGLVKPRAPEGWLDRGTLVASKQRGTLYLVASGREGEGVELRPFANATSAQLLLGADAEPVRVDQSAIDDEPVGATIGIPGAPTTIPAPSRLVQTGWSACPTTDAGDDAIATTLGEGAARPDSAAASDAAVVVRGEGVLWLVTSTGTADEAQARRFRLRGGGDTLLREVGLTARTSDAVSVSADWLALIPRGSDPLTPAALDAGTPAPVTYADRLGGGDLRVGDVAVADGVRYLLTSRGPAELDPFALAVAKTDPAYAETRLDRAPETLAPPTWPQTWPAGTLTDLGGSPCAVLATSESSSRVLLGASDETGEPGEAAGEGSAGVRVQPGHGAVVTGDESGTVLIDSAGVRYPVADDDSLARLGFDLTPPTVPDSWLALLPEGATLDARAAGRPAAG